MFDALGWVPERTGAFWQRRNLGALVQTGILDVNWEFWGGKDCFY